MHSQDIYRRRLTSKLFRRVSPTAVVYRYLRPGRAKTCAVDFHSSLLTGAHHIPSFANKFTGKFSLPFQQSRPGVGYVPCHQFQRSVHFRRMHCALFSLLKKTNICDDFVTEIDYKLAVITNNANWKY